MSIMEMTDINGIIACEKSNTRFELQSDGSWTMMDIVKASEKHKPMNKLTKEEVLGIPEFTVTENRPIPPARGRGTSPWLSRCFERLDTINVGDSFVIYKRPEAILSHIRRHNLQSKYRITYRKVGDSVWYVWKLEPEKDSTSLETHPSCPKPFKYGNS